MQASAGKGSGRRPSHVDHDVYTANWINIFGKKEEKSSLYKFSNPSMENDEVDPKTSKVKKYKEINVIAKSQEEAREKASVSSDWELVSVKDLSPDWK